MLGIEVPRLKFAAIVVLALLTAGQLALHHHSLLPESGASSLVCGVCAFNSDGAAANDLHVEALTFLADVLPLTQRFVRSAVPLASTTRGPPQA
jgi:hypothetical protein